MSFSQTGISTPHKCLKTPRSGGGCGDIPGAVPEIAKRNPIPACRKFTLQPDQRTPTSIATTRKLIVQNIANLSTNRTLKPCPVSTRAFGRSIQPVQSCKPTPVKKYHTRCATLKRSQTVDELALKKSKKTRECDEKADRTMRLNRRRRHESHHQHRSIEAPCSDSLEDSGSDAPFANDDNRAASARTLSSSSSSSTMRERTAHARRVYSLLLLNAWRRTRLHLDKTNSINSELTTQQEHLSIQITVLRRLVNSETVRLTEARLEIQNLNAEIQDKQNEIDTVYNEKCELGKELNTLKVNFEKETTKSRNMLNDLKQTREEVASLEQQLEREREKLIKLRVTEESLNYKIKQMDQLLSARNAYIKDLESSNEEKDSKLAQQETIHAMLRSENMLTLARISDLEFENTKLGEKFVESQKVVKSNLKEIKNLKCEIQRMDKNQREMEKSKHDLEISLQEVTAVVEKHVRRPWWSLAAQLAKLPLGSLHTCIRVMLPALPIITNSNELEEVIVVGKGN